MQAERSFFAFFASRPFQKLVVRSKGYSLAFECSMAQFLDLKFLWPHTLGVLTFLLQPYINEPL
jgi:hypothetical protein